MFIHKIGNFIMSHYETTRIWVEVDMYHFQREINSNRIAFKSINADVFEVPGRLNPMDILSATH